MLPGNVLSSTSSAIEQATNRQHPGDSAFDQDFKRWNIVEHWITVRSGNPLIGKFLIEQDVESLKDADQQRNAGKFVLTQVALTVFLECIIPSARNASQQCHRILILQTPF